MDDGVPMRPRTWLSGQTSLLVLAAAGLTLMIASAWMPWFHFSRTPFSTRPGCSEPAPPILWSAILLAAMAVGVLAMRRPAVGVGLCAGSLAVILFFGLGTGFIIFDDFFCETSESIPAYGMLAAIIGATFVTTATVLSWVRGRRAGP